MIPFQNESDLKTRISFPTTDKIDELELYQYVFPAKMKHPTFACVGFVMTVGAHAPVFEIQARWATQVFQGNVGLPPVNEMLKDIEMKKKFLYQKFGKHIIFVSIKYDIQLINKNKS